MKIKMMALHKNANFDAKIVSVSYFKKTKYAISNPVSTFNRFHALSSMMDYHLADRERSEKQKTQDIHRSSRPKQV